MHKSEPNSPGSPANKEHRDDNIKYCIKGFAQPKDNMLLRTHFLQGRVRYFMFKISVKIQYKHPGKRRNGIHQYNIDILKPVSRHPLLGRAKAHQRTFLNVIIYPIYVCVSMMKNIMFDFPDKLITAKRI